MKRSAMQDDRAELGGALLVLRARARQKPGKWHHAPAGYQRRAAWRVCEDGTEQIAIQREHLQPWLLDLESVREHLPVDLVIVSEVNNPEKRLLQFHLAPKKDELRPTDTPPTGLPANAGRQATADAER